MCWSWRCDDSEDDATSEKEDKMMVSMMRDGRGGVDVHLDNSCGNDSFEEGSVEEGEAMTVGVVLSVITAVVTQRGAAILVRGEKGGATIGGWVGEEKLAIMINMAITFIGF